MVGLELRPGYRQSSSFLSIVVKHQRLSSPIQLPRTVCWVLGDHDGGLRGFATYEGKP